MKTPEQEEYEQAKQFGQLSATPLTDRPPADYIYIPEPEDTKRQEELNRYRDTSKMRNRLGYWILYAVIGQIAILDVGMSHYLCVNIHNPNQAIIIAWLTTNFTEIVGILLVVARSIFPTTKN